MNLTPKQKAIINAERCPYCNSTTRVATQKEVYGKSYSDRSLIACTRYPQCDSFVGTHKDGTSLGRLGDKALRQAKKDAHHHFDKIWHQGYISRTDAYEWLSDELDIPEEYTHIGMFSIKTCKRVVELSIDKLKTLK